METSRSEPGERKPLHGQAPLGVIEPAAAERVLKIRGALSLDMLAVTH